MKTLWQRRPAADRKPLTRQRLASLKRAPYKAANLPEEPASSLRRDAAPTMFCFARVLNTPYLSAIRSGLTRGCGRNECVRESENLSRVLAFPGPAAMLSNAMFDLRLTIVRNVVAASLCIWGMSAVAHAWDFVGNNIFFAGPNIFRGAGVSPERQEELKADIQAKSDTPEQLWAYVQSVSADFGKPIVLPPEVKRDKDQARVIIFQERNLRLAFACEEFIARFPADPHRKDVQFLLLQHRECVSSGQYQELYESIIASADASDAVRHQARVCQAVDALNALRSDFKACDKVLCDFERDYPDDPWGSSFVEQRMHCFSEKRPEDLIVELAGLISSPNKATAAKASEELALRIDPIDLRAKSVTGRDVDLSHYRGKIVLLVFWAASWGNPQDNVIPQVLAARKKFAPDDFQIVGICIDLDKKKMLHAIKAQAMDWPTINDVRDGNCSALATRFHMTSVQGTWLLDREGVGRPVPRGANLDEEIARAIRITMPKR